MSQEKEEFDLSNFIEEKTLWDGAFSTVFKYVSKDKKRSPQEVAVKIFEEAGELDEDINQSSFLRDTHDMTSLKHDNIVATLLVKNDSRPITVVMELCDQNLRVLMSLSRHIEFDEAAYVAEELTKGLTYLHENKISHQGIKPRSVLLKSKLPYTPANGAWEDVSALEMEIKLGGFHSAPQSAEDIKVTTSYRSPEGLRVKHKNPGDFYSVGVIIFELLKKRLPRPSEAPVHFTLQERSTALKESLNRIRCPQELSDFLHYALAKEPDARSSAVEVLRQHSAMKPPPAPLVSIPKEGMFLLDGYKKGGLLGRGASANVYRFKNASNKMIAVKKFKDPGEHGEHTRHNITKIFNREKSTLGKCKGHPNLVQVLGYCYSDHSGLPIIVMELCHQNLQNLKRERKSFSPEDVSHILKKIAEATAFMHNQDILHRDLKPANVLIQLNLDLTPLKEWASGNVCKMTFKVGDFGVSRLIPQELVTLSEVGTPGFWAPELKAESDGKRSYGRPVDVYSLGVIGFVLLCNRLPTSEEAPTRQGTDTTYKLQRALSEEGSTEQLSSVLLKMLKLRPEDRPTAAELVQQL